MAITQEKYSESAVRREIRDRGHAPLSVDAIWSGCLTRLPGGLRAVLE